MNCIRYHVGPNVLRHKISQSNKINSLRNYSCLMVHKSDLQLNKNSRKHEQQFRNFSYENTVTSIWKALSSSVPVEYMQKTLVQIHDLSGLPWWASIVISTFLFRSVITLPLAIYQHKIVARIENLTKEMPDIVKELKQETAMAMRKYGWDEKQARIIYNRSLKKQWQKLIIRDNCHPLKTIIVLWGQIPLWIFQSVALRNLVYMLPDPSSLEAKLIFTQLTVGGFLWVPNLVEVDNSYILPVLLGLINLSIIQIQATLRIREPTKLQSIATNVFRLFSVAMIPIACSVPSCLCIYWVSSSAYGLLQNIFLLSPKIRRTVGIPITSTEHKQPFQHLVNSFGRK